MEKLIITNCATDCSMYPEWVNRFHDSQVLAKSVAAACKKGAAIAHIHAPPDDFKAWESHTKAIREHCDIMIQYGISIQSVEQRRVVMKNKPEMISVAVGAHNLAFVGRDLMLLHPRAELAEMMRMCRDMGVKPEFEVCALGDLWLIDDLCQKGLVDDPIMMTIFFGRPGGTWSPPNPDEFLHRTKHLPKGSYAMASVTGPTHLMLETLAVIAYRQPVPRADIEAIRGVNCGEILRQLMERDLVRIAGRSEDLGRPYLYGTTKRFLQMFGLLNLNQLPRAAALRAPVPVTFRLYSA